MHFKYTYIVYIYGLTKSVASNNYRGMSHLGLKIREFNFIQSSYGRAVKKLLNTFCSPLSLLNLLQNLLTSYKYGSYKAL